MELITAVAVGAVILVTGAAAICAIWQHEVEQDRTDAPLTLDWVHDGLVEPAPYVDDPSFLDRIFGGAQTGAWPMILELADDGPHPRDRFVNPALAGVRRTLIATWPGHDEYKPLRLEVAV